jgi:hypothetical protein
MMKVFSPRSRYRWLTALVAGCSVLIVSAGPAAAASAAKPASPCPQRSGRVVCVDQNHQQLWVQQGAKIIFPAVHVRTGRAGLRTPDGSFRIYMRNQHQWSYLFGEAMPNSFFFFRSYALHGSLDDIRRGGSHGCVNLTLDDSRRLWRVLGKGDLVYIWGHKPGR